MSAWGVFGREETGKREETVLGVSGRGKAKFALDFLRLKLQFSDEGG